MWGPGRRRCWYPGQGSEQPGDGRDPAPRSCGTNKLLPAIQAIQYVIRATRYVQACHAAAGIFSERDHGNPCRKPAGLSIVPSGIPGFVISRKALCGDFGAAAVSASITVRAVAGAAPAPHASHAEAPRHLLCGQPGVLPRCGHGARTLGQLARTPGNRRPQASSAGKDGRH
jgi:hypothetical protein